MRRLNKLSFLLLLALLISQISSSASYAWKADATKGDTALSVGGIHVNNSNGRPYVDGVTNSHGNSRPPLPSSGYVEVPYSHTIVVPPGTNQIKLTTGSGVDNAFANGNNSFNNGHGAINGVGDLNAAKQGKEAHILSGPHVDGPKINPVTGETYFDVSMGLGINVNDIKNGETAPRSAQDLATRLSGENLTHSQKMDALRAHIAGLQPPFNTTGKLSDTILEGMLNDADYLDKNQILLFLVPMVIEITKTEEDVLLEQEQAKDPVTASPTECPTGPYWQTIPQSREVFLRTTQSTVDLPTPPTRNHGPCPAIDNEGFSEWDPAWGANYFPKAEEGEHWKYWDNANKDKGYNKSVHYERRGIRPAATNPPNILKGRPVATTQWTEILDNTYPEFLAESPGKIEYTWVDNSAPEKNSAVIREGTNQTKYCVEAYERLLIPKREDWRHDHYQVYEWNYCLELWDHDSPADKHCLSYSEKCSTDSEGEEYCWDECDEWEYHDVGYHYKEFDPKGGYNTPEWDGGITVKDRMVGILPPVYEPWRKWKHRAELEIEFHASIINENSKLMNFNKLDNPQIKSGYGTMFEGQAHLITDWDKTIVPSAHLVRPNKNKPLNLSAVNKPIFNANGNAPEGTTGSTENKDYIRDRLQIAGSGTLLDYSTRMGTWHAYPSTKGGQNVIPRYGQTRQHFIHLDYPDGNFNVEAWVNVDLVGGQSPWGVNNAALRGIPVKGNMFSDSFVRPK